VTWGGWKEISGSKTEELHMKAGEMTIQKKQKQTNKKPHNNQPTNKQTKKPKPKQTVFSSCKG